MTDALPDSAPPPLASVITPTFRRHAMLPHAYDLFKAQTAGPIEWIVVDDSETQSAFMLGLQDPRVKYIHFSDRLSTGEKRNIAVDAASAEIIVQFDDDDYYSPIYIKSMMDCIAAENSDFAKLSSFFLYSKIYKQYGYWDTQTMGSVHFSWAGSVPLEVVRLPNTQEIKDMRLGYGFSYVFKKSVWKQSPFQHIFWNQDTPFIKSAISNGFKISLLNDQAGLCLHILHESNTSKSFPQYIIPNWLAQKIFPAVDAAYL